MTDTEMLCILLFDKTLDEIAEDILKEGKNYGSERIHTA